MFREEWPTPEERYERDRLCRSVRGLMEEGRYSECRERVAAAMGRYPHAPQPHNLLGLLLERQHDHPMAMRHFRAAWALDPTYLPARQNLECYGTFFSCGRCAYDESDRQGAADAFAGRDRARAGSDAQRGGRKNETV